MKKGYSLIEMLTVLAVLAVIGLPLSRLMNVTLYDIPKSIKLINNNTSILNALNFIRKDVCSASGLTKTSENQLVIEQNGKKICYIFEDGVVLRVADNKIEMQIPAGKIEWQIWEKDGKGYAVEIKKYLEFKKHKKTEKKMENSYVFFAGVSEDTIQ
jgi:prepilin-type N-terminal cleavage/methylation domain-containing protein